MMFIIIFLLAILFTAAFAKVFYRTTEPGEILDRVLGWQKKMEYFGSKTGLLNEMIYKWMGGCEFCYCMFLSFLSFALFVVINVYGVGWWFDFNSYAFDVVCNVLFFMGYSCLSTVVSTLIVTRL